MHIHRKILIVLPLLAVAGACAAGESRYPSLAMRPVETAPPPADTAPPPVPTRPLADAAQLATLVDRAARAHAEFAREQAGALALARAAAGQSSESNARARALVAMADLAAQRGATSAVLADLDGLAAASAIAFAPAQEIEAARQRVAALVAGEDAAMAELWEVLGA